MQTPTRKPPLRRLRFRRSELSSHQGWMGRLCLILVLLSSWAASCVGSQEQFPPIQAEKSDASRVSCKTHDDCEEHEVCHTDELCGVPWGTRYFITECSFHTQDQDLQGKYRVNCIGQHEHKLGVLISLEPQAWDQCALLDPSFIADLHDPTRFHCHFRSETSDAILDPAEVDRGDFCLEDGCPGLSVEDFRSTRAVELRNERGDVLRFRLSARRSSTDQW